MAQVEYQKVEADGSLGQRKHFEQGQRPTLAASKGAWKLRVDTLPANPDWYTVSHEISGGDLNVVYTLKSAADLKTVRLEELAAKRFAVETGGITIGEVAIRTDRESQALVTGALALVTADPERLIDWKGAGGWVQLDAVAMTAIAMAVGTHIQGCFSNEKAHAEAIAALNTSAAIAAYDITTGW
jgi:hypothetical protein